VKLAQALLAAGGAAAPAAAIAEALRGFERERTARAAPVIAKSWIMGFQLRIKGAPVRAASRIPPAAIPLCRPSFSPMPIGSSGDCRKHGIESWASDRCLAALLTSKLCLMRQAFSTRSEATS
jgi:hypothetical protein